MQFYNSWVCSNNGWQGLKTSGICSKTILHLPTVLSKTSLVSSSLYSSRTSAWDGWIRTWIGCTERVSQDAAMDPVFVPQTPSGMPLLLKHPLPSGRISMISNRRCPASSAVSAIPFSLSCCPRYIFTLERNAESGETELSYLWVQKGRNEPILASFDPLELVSRRTCFLWRELDEMQKSQLVDLLREDGVCDALAISIDDVFTRTSVEKTEFVTQAMALYQVEFMSKVCAGCVVCWTRTSWVLVRGYNNSGLTIARNSTRC